MRRPRPLNSVGILGGGLMGGGIARVYGRQQGGLPSTNWEYNTQGINHALKYSWDLLETKSTPPPYQNSERDKQLALISSSTDYRGFSHRDLVIEAVFEDLPLKQRRWWRSGAKLRCSHHFCLNTSSCRLAILRRMRRAGTGDWIALFSPVRKNAAG